MSIEQLLADQTAALRDQTAAIRENTAALLQLHAGREEALKQLAGVAAGGGEAPKTTRTRRTKAEDVGGASTANDSGANDASGGSTAAGSPATSAAGADTSTRRDVDFSEDGLKKSVGDWLQETSDGEERNRRALQVKAMLDHFGSPTVAGPKSTLDEDQRYQATFYVARFIAGLPVDFSTDYDFDADPLTQALPPEPAAGDDLLG
jgi:hypothetical protein